MFETSNAAILNLVQKLAARGLQLREIGKHRWYDGQIAHHVEFHCGAVGICEAIIIEMPAFGYTLFIAPKSFTTDEDAEKIDDTRADHSPELFEPFGQRP